MQNYLIFKLKYDIMDILFNNISKITFLIGRKGMFYE